MYEIGMEILFSKQYMYVTNHLHLYIGNCCIFPAELFSYSLLCVVIVSMAMSPEIHLQVL